MRTFNALDPSGASGNRNLLKGITLYHNVLDTATESQVMLDSSLVQMCVRK